MLDHPARRRLNQLLHAHGLGPDPHVLHLIHQLSNPCSHRTAADNAPDLITEALEYRLVDYETDPETGATELGLHPDVKFSLGITQFRYPPEGEPDESTTEERCRPYRRTVALATEDQLALKNPPDEDDDPSGRAKVRYNITVIMVSLAVSVPAGLLDYQ